MITWIITILVLSVPVVVWPELGVVFNTPKSLLMVVGISLAMVIYIWKPLRGQLDETTNWLIGILIALNVASLFYTRNPYYTKQAIILNLACLGAFYLTALYGNVRRVFQAFIVAGVIVSIVTILQFFWEPYFPSRFHFPGKVTGTIGNSNYIACFLLFPIFACLGLMKSKKRPVVLWSAIAVCLFAILLTRVRSAAFGLVIGGVVLFFMARPKIRWRYIIPVVALLPLLWIVEPVRTKIKPQDWLRTKSMSQRVKYWQAAWELIKQAPLAGHGLWSYRKMVYGAQAKIQQRDPTYFDGYKKAQPRRVHNDYLEVFNDGGLLLFAACGLFLLWTFKQRVRGDPLRAAAFACFIAVMASAIFFFPFRINTTMFSSAVMLGILRGNKA